MKALTAKEEEIMNHIWANGEMQIRELQALYDEPQPHVNTLSTLVRILEEKGFLAHRAISTRCYKYFAKVSSEEYRNRSLTGVIDKLFGKSYLGAVSTLVSEEKISVDELKELIRQIEGGENEESEGN